MATYEMPAYGTTGDSLLGWLMDAVSEGNAWLESQKPALEYDKVYNSFGSTYLNEHVEGMSNLGYNLVERNARDIVASLSNFRHHGEYRPTFDQTLFDRAHALTKLDQSWARSQRAYTVFREALQYAVGFGTAYLVEDWDKRAHKTYGDIRMRAFGPTDVTFIQMPKDHDIQQSYMTIIREELPINLARAIHGHVAGALVPDRESPGWLQRGLQKVQRLMGGSPALAVAGMGQSTARGSYPTVDVYHGYIMDLTINETGQPRRMGARGSNWAYTVPSMGDPVGTGVTNPATGAQWTRPADEDDCRLFPLRRYAIWTRTAVIYDGSSPWWHGDTPVARLRFNDWAWEALGRSLMAEPQEMQKGIEAIMRGIEDAIAARLDPPVLYDDQLASDGFAQNFNPRKAGARAAASLNTGGDVLKYPINPEFYNVPAYIPDYIKQQEERINHQMGTPDLVAMAKAKQVPGQGTLEKLMEMAGPLVDDMVRAQEEPYWQLGEWRKAYYFQFYTRNRYIRIVGPDPLHPDEGAEDFQYSPDLLVGRIEGESAEGRTERARGLISEFVYHLEESSINERHRMANKLALIQLKKAGIKIDDWTIADAFQIHNYGPKPEGTHNVTERWVAEQHMNRELMEEMQAGMPQQGQKGPGRPNSNRQQPSIKQKDGGTRSTIATS